MIEWISERMVYVKKACKLISRSVEGEKVSICFPLEYKTAVLAYELSRFVELKVCRFDDPTTKVEAVRWLEERGVEIRKKEECVDSDYLLDCVASLTRKALKAGKTVTGVIELTKSGVDRLGELYSKRTFKKAISIDDSEFKGRGENIYGTGLGLLDALMRLNVMLPGKNVFVIGFGRVGEGCASVLKKLGCEVEVFDIDKLRCAIAEYMGFGVSEVEDGLRKADIIITATGSNGVINSSNVRYIKSGAILCNMGAARHEIDLRNLEGYKRIEIGEHISKLSGQNHFYVLANGHSVNLTMGNGTPLEIMDKTFALVTLSLEHLVKENFSGVVGTPREVEERLAKLISSVSMHG